MSRRALAALTAGLGLAIAPTCGMAEPEADQARVRLQALLELDRRVIAVADRLRVAGADLCEDPSHLLTGAMLHRPADYGPRLRPAFPGPAAARLVALVAVGSPAGAAGLREGDEVVGMGAPPDHQQSVWTWSIVRDGRPMDLALRPLRVCVAAPRVITSRGLQASAAGGADIRISSELVRIARTDDELAVVLGHEIAHGLLPPARPSREREHDADELGLYLAARAGYDVSGASGFLARLARAHGPLLILDFRHPAPKARRARLDRVAAEIRDRQARGLALVPPAWRRPAAASRSAGGSPPACRPDRATASAASEGSAPGPLRR